MNMKTAISGMLTPDSRVSVIEPETRALTSSSVGVPSRASLNCANHGPRKHARGVVGAIEAAPGEELDLVAFRQRLEDLQPRLVRRGEDEHAYAHRRSSRTFTVSRTK